MHTEGTWPESGQKGRFRGPSGVGETRRLSLGLTQRRPTGGRARSRGRADTALSSEGGRGAAREGAPQSPGHAARGSGPPSGPAPPAAVGCGVRDTRRPAAPPAGLSPE